MASLRRTILREMERRSIKKIKFDGNRKSRRKQTKAAKKNKQ